MLPCAKLLKYNYADMRQYLSDPSNYTRITMKKHPVVMMVIGLVGIMGLYLQCTVGLIHFIPHLAA